MNDEHQESYPGRCSVCGTENVFVQAHRSVREGFHCPSCRSSLRYRAQAECLLDLLDIDGARCLADDRVKRRLESLAVYEPGVSGPLRSPLSAAARYESSFFWPDVNPGQARDGVTCQDLEALTFDDASFDLVVTSDIMEHVRHPWRAFAEIQRVLKPGGWHVFSIPFRHPPAPRSVPRVDTSGEEDVHLLEPHYHGDGAGGQSLVYTDFGLDMVARLARMGCDVGVHPPSDDHPRKGSVLTFSARRKRHGQSVAPARPPACNICGGRSFVPGPGGRLSRNRKEPRCEGCGSLERHRAIRHAWDALLDGRLGTLDALQFSRDSSVDAGWFGSYERSIYDTENSLDIQAIDRPDARYDVVVCNHVLEHVEQDRTAFCELLRVLREDGFLQMTVPAPMGRDVTDEWGFPDQQRHGHFRHYGLDLVDRFRDACPGVDVVRVRSADPVTGLEDYVFWWSRAPATLDALREALGDLVDDEP